jgi:hypothetical protein
MSDSSARSANLERTVKSDRLVLGEIVAVSDSVNLLRFDARGDNRFRTIA